MEGKITLGHGNKLRSFARKLLGREFHDLSSQQLKEFNVNTTLEWTGQKIIHTFKIDHSADPGRVKCQIKIREELKRYERWCNGMLSGE
jgi:hypothetical protein